MPEVKRPRHYGSAELLAKLLEAILACPTHAVDGRTDAVIVERVRKIDRGLRRTPYRAIQHVEHMTGGW